MLKVKRGRGRERAHIVEDVEQLELVCEIVQPLENSLIVSNIITHGPTLQQRNRTHTYLYKVIENPSSQKTFTRILIATLFIIANS